MSLMSAKKLLLVSGGKGGQASFTTPGTFQWTCPAGVTSVCVVAVGGGGRGFANGGGGGGLGWKNKIPVTPGQRYTVVVGRGGFKPNGGSASSPENSGTGSYFISTATVSGGGGQGPSGQEVYRNQGGDFAGDGGGNGGNGGITQGTSQQSGGGFAGGGGAGGYTGAGGAGGEKRHDYSERDGLPGSGGGGAGGGSVNSPNNASGGGGGVGILGQGASGASSSGGGSGGANGTNTLAGAYGGGGGCNDTTARGGNGAVRIIWGRGRAFPSTKTGDL